MRSLGIVVAAFSLLSVITSARAETAVVLAHGKGVVACAEQKCVTVRPEMRSAPLSAIKQGRFLLNYDSSWIEQGSSGYMFCAMAKSQAPRCERLDIPLLQGTRLLYADDGVRNPLLTLAFNRSDNGPDAVQRNAIGKRFVAAFVQARNAIVAQSQTVPAKARVSARIKFSTTDLLDEGGCETAICDGPGDGGGGGGDGGGGYIPPDYDPSGGFAPNPACVAQCTVAHDVGAVYCGTLPDLRLKAICYAGNMTIYGACLAGC